MVLERGARRAAPWPNAGRVVAEIFSADIASPDGGENGGPRRDRAVERRTPRIRIGARRSSHTRPVDHGVPAQCSAPSPRQPGKSRREGGHAANRCAGRFSAMPSLTLTESRTRAADLAVTAYDVHLDLTSPDEFTSSTTVHFTSRTAQPFIELANAESVQAMLNGATLAAEAYDAGRLALSDIPEPHEPAVTAQPPQVTTERRS